MRFQLDITLTEEDYLVFNNFHSLESATGKKLIRRSRILFISIMAVLIVLVILILGWTIFSALYVILLGIFTAIYMLLFKNVLKRNIKMQIKRLKETGKLPFDPVTKLEFYEDKLAETTAEKRLEQSYSVLERICVVENRFIYLYHSSVCAHILPIPQLKEQLDQEDFLSFLSQKCNMVEYYRL